MPIIPDPEALAARTATGPKAPLPGPHGPLIPSGPGPALFADPGPDPGQNPGQNPGQTLGQDRVVRRLRQGLDLLEDQDMRRRMVLEEARFNEKARQAVQEVLALSGEAALPDARGQGGVAQAARERLEALAAECSGMFPGEYGQAFREKIGSLAAFRLNAAARREAALRRAGTGEAWTRAAEQYRMEVRACGGEANTVLKAVHDGLDSLHTLYGPGPGPDGSPQAQPEAAGLQAAFLASMAETSVLAALGRDPDLARENLDRFAAFLPPGRAEALTGLIGKEAGTRRAGQAFAALADLPHDRRLELAAGTRDPDLRARLTDMAEAQERARRGQEALAAHRAELEMTRRLRQAEADPDCAQAPTPGDILADRRLDARARDRLLRKATGRRQAPTEQEEARARQALAARVLSAPRSESRASLLDRGLRQGVDPEDLERLLGLHQEARDNPDLVPALAILRQEARGLARDRGAALGLEEDLAAWAVAARERTGRGASLEELTARGRAALRTLARDRWTAGSRR